MIPAVLTTASTPPKRLSTVSKRRVISAGSATSPGRATAVPPAATTDVTAASAFVALPA